MWFSQANQKLQNFSETFEALVMKLLCWFDAILFIRLYFDAEYIRRSFYCYCNTKMVWMIYSDLCSANSKSCKLLKHVSNGNITNSLKQKLASPFIDSYLNWNVKSRMKISSSQMKGNKDVNLKYEFWKSIMNYIWSTMNIDNYKNIILKTY